jgi:rhodanese-related sulfurtransferase
MKHVIAGFVMMLASATTVLAANYIDAEDLKKMLDQKIEIVLVDIQPAADFEKQHLPGSIETNAFPGKTDAEKIRLDKALSSINATKAPVIVICPSGKSGAKNSFEYLLTKGVPKDRLQILDGGIFEWPFKELFVKGR